MNCSTSEKKNHNYSIT